MTKDIVARLLCSALMLYAPITALTSDMSVAAWSTRAQFIGTTISLACLIFLAFFNFVDIVFNDLLDDKYSWRFLERAREWLYLFGAFFCIVIPFTANKLVDFNFGANYLYVIICIGTLGMAWCDAYAKTKVGRRKDDKRAEALQP